MQKLKPKKKIMQDVEFATISKEFGEDTEEGTVEEIHVTLTSFSKRGNAFDEVFVFSQS